MIRLLPCLLLVACASPGAEQHAPSTATAAPIASAPIASAPATASTASASASVAPPPQESPKQVLFQSRDAVPEALRAAVPATLDFRTHVLAGWLRPGNAVQVLEKPAVVEERDGVLRVVGIVHHIKPKTRKCPGGRPEPPEIVPTSEEMRLEGITPNFLVVLDRARAMRVKSIVVVYGKDVEDAPDVHVDPNAPCPPYP